MLRITPALTSISSDILSYNPKLDAILIHGDGFDPKADPLPVVNAIILQPLAIWPVTDAGSYPGLSINTKPLSLIISAYLYTPFNFDVPALETAPNDFSRIVVNPPILFPGDGLLSIVPKFLFV